MISRAGVIYVASLAAHGALALGIVSLKGPKKYEDVSISMVETKKKQKEQAKVDEPPPPPPPPAKVEAAKAKAAPVAKAPAAPVEAAPAAAAPVAAPDFGLSLGGGGGAGPGLAVRAAAPPPASSVTPAPVHKVLNAAPAPTAKCDEPLKKPRPISISQPAYTSEARTANIAGKVRVEITVDEAGHVTKVRVLEGLGYGLDEAAIASARVATFEAGTLCGKPTTATFTVAMRFTL